MEYAENRQSPPETTGSAGANSDTQQQKEAPISTQQQTAASEGQMGKIEIGQTQEAPGLYFGQIGSSNAEAVKMSNPAQLQTEVPALGGAISAPSATGTGTGQSDVADDGRLPPMVYTVALRDLPREITDNEISQFFESTCGPVFSARVARDKRTGECRGFGLLKFKTLDGVLKALEMKPPEFHGERISVNFFVEKNTLYVGNLPFALRASQLKQELEQIGGEKMDKFELCLRSDGKSKGYGWAIYPDHETALAASHLLSTARVHGFPIKVAIVEARVPDPRLIKHEVGLFVKNLPPDVAEDRIRQFFGGSDVVDSVDLPKDLVYKRPVGHCIVRFRDHRLAEEALERFSGTVMDGNRLVVEWVFRGPKKHRPPPPPPSSSGSRRRSPPRDDPYYSYPSGYRADSSPPRNPYSSDRFSPYSRAGSPPRSRDGSFHRTPAYPHDYPSQPDRDYPPRGGLSASREYLPSRGYPSAPDYSAMQQQQPPPSTQQGAVPPYQPYSYGGNAPEYATPYPSTAYPSSSAAYGQRGVDGLTPPQASGYGRPAQSLPPAAPSAQPPLGYAQYSATDRVPQAPVASPSAAPARTDSTTDYLSALFGAQRPSSGTTDPSRRETGWGETASPPANPPTLAAAPPATAAPSPDYARYFAVLQQYMQQTQQPQQQVPYAPSPQQGFPQPADASKTAAYPTGHYY